MTQTNPPAPEPLQRFVDAQAPVWEAVIEELRSGRKETHWMWFVFPQIAGLGTSRTSQRYALAGETEVQAYATHPVLGARLRHCFELVLAHRNRTAESIFGAIDAKKLQSCATLFRVCDGQTSLFDQALTVFFNGEPDQATLSLVVT